MKKVMPLLMFQDQAKAAIEIYKILNPEFKGLDYIEFSTNEPNPGQVKMASLSLKGQEVLCNDSPIRHEFTFTPSFSFFCTASLQQNSTTSWQNSRKAAGC